MAEKIAIYRDRKYPFWHFFTFFVCFKEMKTVTSCPYLLWVIRNMGEIHFNLFTNVSITTLLNKEETVNKRTT